jgi:hypothetical protein
LNNSDFPNTTIRLLRPVQRGFTGEDIAFDIVSFLESETGIHRSVNLTLPSLDNATFHPFLRQHQSNIVGFLDFRYRQSEIVLPQLWQLCFIFSRERGVGIGFVDCSKMIKFCQSVYVSAAPPIRLSLGDKIFDFEENRDFDKILWFVNSNLGTFRKEDGELNDVAGLIPNVFQFVQEFMNSESKSSALEAIRKIEGTEYYVSVMKKLPKEGGRFLDTEIQKYENWAKQAVDKPELRDAAIRNLNVLKEFQRLGPYISPRSEL